MTAPDTPEVPPPPPQPPVEPPVTRKRLKELTPEEMHTLINTLKPKNQLHAGIRFLHMVVDRDGVEGLLKFAEHARETIDKEGELKSYDFERDDEKKLPNYMDLLKRARPNIMDRRTFFQTSAWGISGAVFTAWGALQTADQIAGYLSGQTPSTTHGTEASPSEGVVRKAVKGTANFIDQHLMAPAEVLVGLALVYEDRVKWQEIKLDEIANAVAEFGDHIDLDKNVQPKRRKRGNGHAK